MSQALQVQDETALAIANELHIVRAPKEILEGAREAAVALKEVISHKAKKVVFNGEQYLQYEDWQTIGGFFSCSVATGDAELIEINGVPGFKAKARVINDSGIEVSSAESYCMKDEANWKNKPIFQLASMAQTRAGAKALRNKFAWVAVLAGYSPTPAEEMEGVHGGASTTTVEGTGEQPKFEQRQCPDCNGPMWDNRATKKGKQPDFKCKDRSCNKAVWLDSEPKTEGYSEDQILRDQLFKQAETLLAKLDPEKRKEKLGNLLMLSTALMAEKVNELAENARKKKPPSTFEEARQAESERERMLREIRRDAKPEQVNSYLDERFEGAELDGLSDAELQEVHVEFVIPF